MANRQLEHTTIVVTRPAKQADGLSQLIESHGGTAIRFPTIEIGEPDDTEQLGRLFKRLPEFNKAIFISTNAVEGAGRYINQPLPESLSLVAVGKRTASAVRERWQRQTICPQKGANSEALLALPEFQQVAGQRILIVRGQGGRELLAEALTEKGAIVEYAEVYQRLRPALDLASLQQQQIDLLTSTSNESLQNLYDMAADSNQREWLLSKPLVVISQRAATLAHSLGFLQPSLVATDTSDTGLLDAMLQWRNRST